MERKAWILVLVAACVVFAADQRLIRISDDMPPIKLVEEEIIKLKNEGVQFVDVTDFPDLSVYAVPNPSPLPDQPCQKVIVRSLLPKLKKENLPLTTNLLGDFFTRYYTTETGVEAAELIFAEAQALVSMLGSKASVHFFNNTFPQPSVIVSIEGNGDSDEIVILGSHLDSTAGGATKRSPGADDDGSGVASVLEVLRVISEAIQNDQFNNNRTIQFHFYAAEEAGLRGSRAIASAYQNENVNVYSMLQLDMAGYKGPGVIGLVTDYTNATLNSFIRDCINAYCDISYQNTKCGYKCSDHASWTEAGYRASFPIETPFGQHNPYIHSAEDVTDKLDPAHWVEFAKLGLGYVIETSSTECTD